LTQSSGKYGIGIDIGGTTFSIGVFDANGALVDDGSYDTPVTTDADAIADRLANTAQSHADGRPGGLGNVVGIAVGFPGPVDPGAGVVKKAPNVHCLEGYALTEALAQRLGETRVHLQNDAYCATLAELRWGAGKDVENLLMFTLGTGVGGGVAMDNQVIRGPRQILGEVGHLIIVPDGRKCGCGGFGCLEAVAAKQGIIDLACRAIQSGRKTLLIDLVDGDQSAITPQVITEACRQGDQAALEVYEQVAFYLGIALCNCIVLTDPDIIVIGGGIAAAGEFIFEPLKRTVAARSPISGYDVSKIVPATFGNDAGIHGAGALAWEHA